MQQLAVEEKRLGQIVQPGQHRCARGSQAGKRLEKCLRDRHVRRVADDEGDGTHAPQHHPEQHHDEEAFLGPEFLFLVAVGEPEQEAEQEGYDEGVDELGTTAITIPKSDHRGQQHGRAEQGNQQTDDTNDAQNLHSGSLFRLKERWILAI